MIERLLSRLLITICIYVYIYIPLSQELCRLLCAPPRGLGSPLCRTSVSCADLHLTLLTTMNNFKPSAISCVCTIWAINSAMASYQNDVNVMPSFCQMIMVAYRSVKSGELMWRLLVFHWFACRILQTFHDMSDITRLQCFRHPKKWRCEIRCGTWLALLIKFFRPKGSNKLNKLNKLCNSAYHMIRSLLEFDPIWSIFHVFFMCFPFSLKTGPPNLVTSLSLLLCLAKLEHPESHLQDLQTTPNLQGKKIESICIYTYKSVSTCMNQWNNT